MNRIIIIGAGPAGMACAIAAADYFESVVVLEKNEKPGKKLYITGKGRCNVTNACDDEAFMNSIVHNSRFMYSAFRQFDNRDWMDLIEAAGCPLKVERGQRVFPVSDKSSDIIRALGRAMADRGVELRLGTKVKEIAVDDSRVATGVRLSDGTVLTADRVVIATGGLSYVSTGSDGWGMAEAGRLGHRIVPCRPSLVGLDTREKWPGELQGLTLKNVDVTLRHRNKGVETLRGELLLTHFGISGPTVLSLSAKMDADPAEYTVEVDLKPALTDKQLDQRILRDFEKFNNRDLRNGLGELLPSRMIPVVLSLAGIDGDKKVNQIGKDERKKLVRVLKGMSLQITDFYDMNTAVVTSGGVDVREINPKTMESKLIPHLHFAGEIIDVDGLTGGFNIQIAASTGYAAGRVSERKNHANRH